MLRFSQEHIGRCHMASESAVEEIEDRIAHVAANQKLFAASGLSLIETLQVKHVVMEWLFSQPFRIRDQTLGVREANEANIVLLNGLWDLCAKHGIVLDTAQKVLLYQDYLND